MADYTPTLGDFTELKPFRFWCQKVLPLVYDDSLSYYELLCKVVDYLNKTMEDVDTMHDDVVNLHSAYVQLQTYVNTYFDNLDVQEEINNKLDEMAQDGSLSALIQPFIPDIVTDWLDEHLTPTSPTIDNTLTVSGACADAKVTGDGIAAQYKTTATYNVGDRVLYNGGLYRCKYPITQAEVWNSHHWIRINLATETDNAFNAINAEFPYIEKALSETIYAWPTYYNYGYLIRSDGIIWVLDNYGTSDFIPVEANKTYLFCKASNETETPAKWISFYNSSKEFISGSDGNTNYYITTPNNAAYCTVGIAKSQFNNLVILNPIIENVLTVAQTTLKLFSTDKQERINNFALSYPLSGKINLALLGYYRKDYYRNSEGVEIYSEGWTESCRLAVKENTSYSANYTTFICYYHDDTFLSAPAAPGTSFTTPETCNYVVISWNYSHKDYAFVEGAKAFDKESETIYVGQNEAYTKLIDAVWYSNSHRNVTIIVRPGLYDLVTEYGGQQNMPGTGQSGGSNYGMQIGNGVKIIFEEGAMVQCLYTGGDSGVEEGFSIFNAIHPVGNSDYEIIGLNCKAKNIRYCIHDEMASSESAYSHRYYNCNMYLDNTESSWTAKQCIGGGLGKHGSIIVENCVFESHGADDDPAVSWHNHYMANSKSTITIAGCYFVDGRIEFYNYGQQTENTICKVYDNSAEYPPRINGYSDYPEKIVLYAWNNEIRNS